MTNIFGLCARLARVVVLVVVALSGMSTAALAMSQACSEINDFWGAGRTIAPAGDELEQEIINHGALASGETLIWAFSTTGTASGSNFVIFQITMNGANDLLFYSSADQGNVTNAIGTHTVTQADNPARGLDVMWSVDNPSGETGNSLTAKIYCTSPVVAPTLSGISPTSGPVAGGTRVTLTGAGLGEADLVTFGGLPGSDLTINSDTSISVTTPALGGGGGVAAVRVSTPHGAEFVPGGFRYFSSPKVSSVLVPESAAHPAFSNLQFIVSFDQPVVVTGTPQLELLVGADTRYALCPDQVVDYRLYCGYRIAGGDNDADGIELGALLLNGGSIRDHSDTVDADLTLNSVGDMKGVLVDTIDPTVISSVPDPGALPTDERVNFVVTFSERIVSLGSTAFQLSTTGTASGDIFSAQFAPDGLGAVVTVADIEGDGTISVGIRAAGISDAAGNSLSGAYSSGTPHTVVPHRAPDAPFINRLEMFDGQATVGFTPPPSNGGSPITHYTVTSDPEGKTATGTSSPIVVSGLSKGTTYTFTMTATNAVGTSVQSNQAGPMVSIGPPSAPAITAATPGDGEVTLVFSTPADDGGSPISDYTVSVLDPDGSSHPVYGAQSPLTLTGLTNGRPYSFRVAAFNGSFYGEYSVPYVVTPRKAPTAPSISVVKPGDRQVEVQFLPPVANGGASVTHYTVLASPGYHLQTGASSPITVGGLTNGTPYTIIVTAHNEAGVGALAEAGPIVPIGSELALTPQGTLPDAMAGEAYSVQFAAAGASGSVTYGTIDSLPVGLTLSASGQLSGTPAGASSGYARSLAIYASDSQGRSGSATVDLRVVPRAVTARDHEVALSQGSSVVVNLTEGATGGPFYGVTTSDVTPAHAGTLGFSRDCPAGQIARCLLFTPDPDFSGAARLTYWLESSLGVSNAATISITVEAAPIDLDAISETFAQLSQDFVTTRAGLLSGGISEPGIRDRRSMGSGNAPGSVSATASGNSATLNFAGSTLELEAFQAMDRAVAVDTSGLNFWIDGTATLHVRNQEGGDSWGSFALASVGADVMVDKNLLVGVALHSDWMEDLTDISAVEGRGVLVGPYLSAELTEGLFLDASVYYGQSWNRAESGAFGGDFETQRLLVKARLEGEVTLSEVLALRSSATLFYLREEMGGYAVTDGSGAVALVEGFATEQLRLSGGLRLDYSLDWADGLTLSPYGDLRLGLMMTDGQEGVFGTLGLGAEVLGLGDWRFSLGSELGLDSQGLRSVSGKVGAGIRF